MPGQIRLPRHRKHSRVEVVLPPPRKEVKEVEEFRRKQLELLEEIRELSESHRKWLEKLYREMVASRKATELQTQVMYRWVSAQENGKAAVGGWRWEFEEVDEADDSDYEVEEESDEDESEEEEEEED